MNCIWGKYLLYSLFFLIFSLVVKAQEYDKITVTGKAEVFRKPDVAYITLYLRQHGVLTVDAVKKAIEKTEEIRKVIKKTAPDILDIEIIDIRLGERTSKMYRPSEESVPTPEVIKRIRITSKPIPELVHKIVDAAIRAEAIMQAQRYMDLSSHGTVLYGLTKFEDAYNEAKKQAFANAKLEAQNIADLLGRKLGKVLKVNSQKFQTYRRVEVYDPFPTEFVGASPEKIRIPVRIVVDYKLE